LYSVYINNCGESDGEDESEINSTTQELLRAMLTFPWDAMDAVLLSLMRCFDDAGSHDEDLRRSFLILPRAFGSVVCLIDIKCAQQTCAVRAFLPRQYERACTIFQDVESDASR